VANANEFEDQMKIVVTGGAGFIGANLCRYLVNADQTGEIVAFDDLSTGISSNLDGSGAELVIGSILDRDSLASVCRDAKVIVHLAARPSVPRSISDPMSSHQVNATGTVEVLNVARTLDNPLVIVASSSSVYGANPELPKRESLVPMPMSPYAVSKLATEQYALAWQHSFGLRTLAFRFFNVFGPMQTAGHAYAAAIPAFIAAALADEPLPINGDGQQTRDFTYVGTLCSIVAEAIRADVTRTSPVNLAFGTRTSLNEVIDLIEEIVGTTLIREHGEPRVGDVRHSQADNSLLRSMFPTIVPVDLTDGIQRTVDWMRAQSSHTS
jgi:UDP-glucose 4-epimerase